MPYRGLSAPFVLWLVLYALAVGPGCATTSPPEPARAQWHEARSAHVQLWTDADPDQARQLVEELERFHQLAMRATTAEEREAAPPLRMFLAKDTASFRAAVGASKRVRGYFVPTARGNFAIMVGASSQESGLREPSGRTQLLHEYAHYVLALEGARVPSWYNEGFAEYLAQTRFQEGAYAVGCPPRYRSAWAERFRWLPIEQVMQAESVAALAGGSDVVGTGRDPIESYAQSWYMFHYFAADAERQGQLSKYLKLWDSGASTADVVQQAFGMELGQLDALIRGYAERKQFECLSSVPYDVLAVPQVALRPLSASEASYRIGDLVLGIFGPTDAALSLLQAGAADKSDAGVQRSLARAHWLKARSDEAGAAAALQQAEQYLQRAKQLAPGDPEALALEGHLLRLAAQKAQDPAAAKEQIAAARKAYRKALHADEALGEAWLGLGATYLLDDNGSEEAVAAFEVAAFLLPLETQHALDLGQLHIQRGNLLQAIPALEYVLRWSQDEVVRAEARGAIERLRTMAAAPAAPAEAAPVAPAAPAPEAAPVPAPAQSP